MELWEQNEKPGKKLFITGKGRCNVTNACDMEELLGSVVSNSKFLYSSFYGFTNQDMMDLLEQAGLHLKVERGNRVFPQSDKSSDVINALSALLRQAGVRVCLNQKAGGTGGGGGRVQRVRCGGRIQTADRVIVATGGLSLSRHRLHRGRS
ncbi:MAG: NAD(P)/FAD-dependent oxidoreductase [[Clostridium] symbiosum]